MIKLTINTRAKMSKWFEYKQEIFNLDKFYRIYYNEYSITLAAEKNTPSKVFYFESEAEKDKIFEQIKKILIETDSQAKPLSRCY